VAMWWFFRNLALIVSPMVVAMVSAGSTMALLVISGNTIHIMSSMIPVFIMPIAVLDAVHILSEFYDRYQETRDRRRTMYAVMRHLFTPMLFTTLTTAAGFASLALTPIPPVQVFGIFVAIGVFLAWFWTMTFVPAFVMLIPEKRLADFGLPYGAGAAKEKASLMDRWLGRVGRAMSRHTKPVLALTAVAVVIAAYGISRITINDNPVKWFEASHPIRVADRILNQHFGGTYMAYLAVQPGEGEEALTDYLDDFLARLGTRAQAARDQGLAAAGAVFDEFRLIARETAPAAGSKAALLEALGAAVEARMRDAPAERLAAWDEVQLFLDSERQRDQVFKQPDALRYLAALQERLLGTDVVGKSNSLVDIVKTVHRELLLGEPQQFRIPDSANAVAQTLLTYQSSHRPQDLWHFVTPDYRKASIWVQLRSGDNQDMSRVVQAIADATVASPPPFDLKTRWFGLNYINVAWQERMVSGMLLALLGSFVVVLVMMIVLFRSLLWGLLSMIPLSVTIGLIYGLIGLIGKDYDMPIAVLSALSLGLAIDYAIHFLARSRAAYAQTGSWRQAIGMVFGEPARAITRNAIILGVGFLPLVAASLLPYKTVGVFIAAILLTAGLGTLVILPALVTVLERWLFARPRRDGLP
ncbi:MAG: RND family transporter, partial [Kiloniellales bacterium]